MSRTCRALAVAAVLAGWMFAAGNACAMEGGVVKKMAGRAQLPDAAANAVKEAYPDATISKVKAEEVEGVQLFIVTLGGDKSVSKVEVAPDGTIVWVLSPVATKDVPEAVSKAVAAAVAGAKVKVAKKEIRAEVKKEGETAKVVKLEKPKVTYRADVTSGTQKGDMEIAGDGKVVKDLTWEEVKAQIAVPKSETKGQ